MRLSSIIILIILAFSNSCIDPFVPDTARYDDMLFIECLISNDTSNQAYLTLSRSVPILTMEGGQSNNIPQRVEGARARIDCKDGDSFYFSEPEPGVYQISDDFLGKPGKSYKLFIEAEGETFESPFQTMLSPNPIDTIRYQPALTKLTENGPAVQGYRFYVSTHSNDRTPSFYRWDMQATYKYSVPLDATHKWNGRRLYEASNDSLRVCWRSKKVLGIFIGNTVGLSENRIQNTPLHFESQFGYTLSIRYSLFLRQRTISESAWTFWNNIDKLVNQTGGLYETQPFRIEGNISCTSDPNLFVAGIFEVSGLSQKRIFVNRPTEFSIIPVTCDMDSVGTQEFPWYQLPPGSWVTGDTIANEYLTSYPRCYDCRQVKGGTLKRPSFWR